MDVKIGQFPVLEKQRKEFVPVDFASMAIVHASTGAHHLNKCFHLVPTVSGLRIETLKDRNSADQTQAQIEGIQQRARNGRFGEVLPRRL